MTRTKIAMTSALLLSAQAVLGAVIAAPAQATDKRPPRPAVQCHGITQWAFEPGPNDLEVESEVEHREQFDSCTFAGPELKVAQAESEATYEAPCEMPYLPDGTEEVTVYKWGNGTESTVEFDSTHYETRNTPQGVVHDVTSLGRVTSGEYEDSSVTRGSRNMDSAEPQCGQETFSPSTGESFVRVTPPQD